MVGGVADSATAVRPVGGTPRATARRTCRSATGSPPPFGFEGVAHLGVGVFDDRERQLGIVGVCPVVDPLEEVVGEQHHALWMPTSEIEDRREGFTRIMARENEEALDVRPGLLRRKRTKIDRLGITTGSQE